MKPIVKYKTAQNFRSAVQEKLKVISRNDGIDIMRLYRQVGYTHLLARLFKNNDVPWALKGGHALELRLQESRATKDIDLTLKEEKLLRASGGKRLEAIKEVLIEKSRIDLGDYFEFLVSGPEMELDAAPYGGARFHVEVLINGITFTKFDLDIGIGDVWIEPHDKIEFKNHLSFTGFETPKIEVISIEQHFAEKIHAYSLPRISQNSRVKDLVDLYLIIENEKIDIKLLQQSLKNTFQRRGTHDVPSKLEAPPQSWKKSFAGFDLDKSLEEAFQIVFEYYKNSF